MILQAEIMTAKCTINLHLVVPDITQTGDETLNIDQHENLVNTCPGTGSCDISITRTFDPIAIQSLLASTTSAAASNEEEEEEEEEEETGTVTSLSTLKTTETRYSRRRGGRNQQQQQYGQCQHCQLQYR